MKFEIKGSTPALLTTLSSAFLTIYLDKPIFYMITFTLFTAVTFICLSIESLKDEG